MKNINILKFLEIDDKDPSNKVILDKILHKILLFKNDIITLINDLKNDHEKIYPYNSLDLYVNLKKITISMCSLLYSITDNPIYQVNTEQLSLNNKVCSLDIFLFFLYLVIQKCKIQDSEINLFFDEIMNIDNFEYKIDVGYCVQIVFDSNINIAPTTDITLIYLR